MASFNRWSRKLHRWGAILIALPLLLVILSGLLLQLKKQVPWVQPPTLRGQGDGVPRAAWEVILAAVAAIPEAGVQSWSDIDRLDVQPSRSLVKVQCKNRWEVQLDLANGAVLSSNFRRSDLIESLHDGSFFGQWAKLAVFLPNGLVLLGLWCTGLYLWYLPGMVRRRKRARRKTSSRNDALPVAARV
jgi:uncharacterized iron-regulated membrane protein